MPPTSPLDPDRLLPADPRTRDVARDLYLRVSGAPIVSPHGHVPAESIRVDAAFGDPAALLISTDHYVTRLLHAEGVDLAALGVGAAADPRSVWRLLAAHWHAFAGTASAYWLRHELATVFGITDDLTPANADALHDTIAATIAEPGFRPRALFERFGIEVLATTDDPLDDLAAHAALRDDPAFHGRVLPTFRPDRFIDPDSASFDGAMEQLLAATGRPGTFAGYLGALEDRRRHFIEHGAVSLDVGVTDPTTIDLDAAEAEAVFRRVLAGTADTADRRLLRGHLLLQLARMSVDDGLVLTLHAGVLRNHSSATFAAAGPDTGHDIPVRTSFTRELRPLLERFGLERRLHLVLFTVDETAWSRELAPLAGFYPSVYVGAPWWFLDAPDAMLRWRSAVTETAGFARTSGFVDDTRAFLSIPARHDTARRVDAAFLARLVVEGRVSQPVAERISEDLVGPIPRAVFKL